MGARERNFREVVMMVVEQTKIGGVTTLRTRRAGFDGSTSLNRAEPEPEPETERATTPRSSAVSHFAFDDAVRRRDVRETLGANLDRCRAGRGKRHDTWRCSEHFRGLEGA